MSILGERGRAARVTLIDRKEFECSGPAGCNMCAGAIGPSMVGKIERLGLPLDKRVVRRIADGYEIHGQGISVTVDNPGKMGIYTVFRGGGPVSRDRETKSFDQFLLEAAKARGAEFLHERVIGIETVPGGYRLGFTDGSSRKFDFLVGAFGVNSSVRRMLRVGYVPPKTWHTVQAEIPADNDFIVGRLHNRIHIVPAQTRTIRFLAITPKDDVLTLTGIGEYVKIADLERERMLNRVLASLLPEGARVLCHCHPQVPVGVAVDPIQDRFAVVGDAFISRHLKNGIESSHDTARILALALTNHGVSRESLREHFHRPCLRLFRYDNVWGKVLFGIYESVLRKGRLSDSYLRIVKEEGSSGDPAQARILWSIFAGDSPYRDIAFEAFSPGTIVKLLRAFLRRR
jgi:flavin-dependent dehydrogenase